MFQFPHLYHGGDEGEKLLENCEEERTTGVVNSYDEYVVSASCVVNTS